MMHLIIRFHKNPRRTKDITDALKFCVDRPPEFITEYLEENFSLAPVEETESTGEEVNAKTESTSQPHTDESDNHTSNNFEEDQPFESSKAKNADYESVQWRQSVKSSKPSLIERFARSLGFHKENDHRFIDQKGNWIGKSISNTFPWGQWSLSGELVCYYWLKEHCLENEPLQIEAEVWGLLDKFPQTHVLILIDKSGQPVEVPGYHLRAMLTDGRLQLCPATYRLIYDNIGPFKAM